MVFKTGSRVEVWTRREVPSGSWWSAEIVSGNGQTFSVRYDGYPTGSSVAVDRVPRKAIRPLPPLVGGVDDLVSGDVVEVLDNKTWKLAEVSKVNSVFCYVRLPGSSRELKVLKSNTRIQLAWYGSKWVLIHKDPPGNQTNGMLSTPSRGGKFGHHISQLYAEMDSSSRKDGICIESHEFADKTSLMFPRAMKKRPCSIPVEMCNGRRRKMRAIVKDGGREALTVGHPIQCLEKVDAVVSPDRILGEKYMHSSLINRTTAPSKMVPGRKISGSDKQKFVVRSSGSSDAESTSSSVGSCSVSSTPCRSEQHHVTYHYEEPFSHSDYAESSCGLERESSLPRKELQAEIHQLELNAYRSTLIALYASGPISWEREALITNLRLMLNISNDEHLVELRNLLHSEIAT